MFYHAAENRCAVDFGLLGLPISEEEALGILKSKGFEQIDVNVVAIAENLVGKAEWKWAARSWDAPKYFDCSSLTMWIYAQRGIEIPRRSIQQFEFCRKQGEGVRRDDLLLRGDLIFITSPYFNGKLVGDHSGIGHVCLHVGKGNVICATNSEFGTGVVNLSFHELFHTRKICGVGRVIPGGSNVITLKTPPHREIKTSDDIKHIILQTL